MYTYEVWTSYRGVKQCHECKDMNEVADIISTNQDDKYFKIDKILKVKEISAVENAFINRRIKGLIT